jgi:hypothetical protein
VRQGDVLVVDRSVKAKAGRVAVVVCEGAMRVQVLPSRSAVPLDVWGVVTFIIHPTLPHPVL